MDKFDKWWLDKGQGIYEKKIHKRIRVEIY